MSRTREVGDAAEAVLDLIGDVANAAESVGHPLAGASQLAALREVKIEAGEAVERMRTLADSAVVYPPDGTVSPFTVINLGAGAVQMGDSVHDGRLPALWFGKNGQGMWHEEEMNREARLDETIAVVTFANPEGLDVLLEVIQRIRSRFFGPEASGDGECS